MSRLKTLGLIAATALGAYVADGMYYYANHNVWVDDLVNTVTYGDLQRCHTLFGQDGFPAPQQSYETAPPYTQRQLRKCFHSVHGYDSDVQVILDLVPPASEGTK